MREREHRVYSKMSTVSIFSHKQNNLLFSQQQKLNTGLFCSFYCTTKHTRAERGSFVHFPCLNHLARTFTSLVLYSLLLHSSEATLKLVFSRVCLHNAAVGGCVIKTTTHILFYTCLEYFCFIQCKEKELCEYPYSRFTATQSVMLQLSLSHTHHTVDS